MSPVCISTVSLESILAGTFPLPRQGLPRQAARLSGTRVISDTLAVSWFPSLLMLWLAGIPISDTLAPANQVHQASGRRSYSSGVRIQNEGKTFPARRDGTR